MNYKIDNLQYCKWSREVFQINRDAGLDAVHVTVVYHEDYDEFLKKVSEWNTHFKENSDLIFLGKNYKDIENAYKKIKDSIVKTPLVTNDYINNLLNSQVYFKLENLQNTGSFKLRGATHKISTLSKNKINNGVVAYSSGNHAQAVAYAALQKNIMEHIALMAQEQIEMEFKEELMQLQQLQMQMAPIQQQMQMNPQALQQNPQVMQMQQQMQNLTQAIESRKATLIAETLAEYQAEEEMKKKYKELQEKAPEILISEEEKYIVLKTKKLWSKYKCRKLRKKIAKEKKNRKKRSLF